MLAVKKEYRKLGIGTKLVTRAVEQMKARDASLVVLETELSNTAALKLYTRLGFCKESRLRAYYLNGANAYRLKLWLKAPAGI
jgi:N-alpha-acetyltransferase 30